MAKRPWLRTSPKAALMPLFGALPTPRLLADLAKLLAALVDVELRDAVVVGDEEIGIAGAAQVGGDGGQRPAAAVDAQLLRTPPRTCRRPGCGRDTCGRRCWRTRSSPA